MQMVYLECDKQIKLGLVTLLGGINHYVFNKTGY